MIRSGNPSMSVFRDQHKIAEIASPFDSAASKTMTVQGTVNASGILITLCAAGAVGGWGLVAANPGLMLPAWLGGMLVSLALSLVIIFKKTTAPFVAPVYAITEGVFLGAFSLFVAQMLADKSPGLGGTTVLQAVLLTFSIFAAMLIAYTTKLIKPGKVFRACVTVGAGGLMLFYLFAFAGSLLGFDGAASLMSIQNASPLSIGISGIAIVLASLFLILDFQMIDEGAKAGLPKYMEWYGGFALLVTLAWLYIEVLRLLAKLRSSD